MYSKTKYQTNSLNFYEAWVFKLIVFICLFWRIQFNSTTLAEGKEGESGELE